MRLVGTCDQGSRLDGVQVMVHRGYVYQNAGVRAFDIRDQHRPHEVGAWAAGAREHDGSAANRARVIRSADGPVDKSGLIYGTDYNTGLFILEYGR